MIEFAVDYCPYCGESLELMIDCSIPHQDYIEDCQVCCRPMTVKVECSDLNVNLQLLREDDY